MFFFKSLFLFAPILSAAGAVTNDWSKPCTSGSCSWTTGDGKNTAWGTLEINAVNTKSLSDITTAAGWEILNCDPNSVEPQDIRLVCVDRAKGCDQLFEGGAENTIVRLPENCAGGPFARVKTTWIDEDQSLPPRLAKRQAGKPAQVRGLALDFNFDQIPESNGKVYITATATNSEAQRDALGPALSKRSMMPLRHANKRAQQAAVVRDFATANLARQVPANRVERRFFKKIGKALKKAAKKIGDGVKKVVDKVKDVAAPIVEKVKQVAKPVVKIVEQAAGQVKKFVNAVKDLTSVNIDESASFDLINIDRNFPIISESIDCPAEDGQIGFEAGIDINVDVKAQVTATVGIIISGSIIPPDLDEFAATAGLNGGVVSTFNVKANAKGTFSTGEIELFKAGLPGLSIPGILTVGPSVSLRTQANAELSITADMSLTASYDLPTLELVFPPGAGRDSVADVKPKTENPLRIDVGASVELRGRAEAHLIPRIDIGIDLLKIAKASVFLNVDGFAALNLELDATANGTPVQGDVDGVDVDFSNIETTFGGEISMDLGVSINAGAEASLLSFFNEDTKVELFSATFPVFEKKFGDRAQKREVLALPPAPAKRQANGLICPAPGEANPVNSIA